MVCRSGISPHSRSTGSGTFCLVAALLLLPALLAAQTPRTRRILATADTVRIDTLSLVPGSWRFSRTDGKRLPDSLFTVDWVRSLLIRKQTEPSVNDSIRVDYQVFPVDFSRVYYHKASGFNRISAPVYRPPGSRYDRESLERLSEGSLRSNGSLSRGVAVGNNRDASLTSNLNLQLDGKLSRDYRIEASLSDANIPVQPDGTTQQIQEFDKVYMRIYNQRNEIMGGDFDIRPLTGYFLQMNKRVQGGRFTTTIPVSGGKGSFRTSTGAAVVKGKYAFNRIQGIEGNLGPYLLTGANGENYIQVIAGSEKVYLDGKPLTRGEDADYTIDYNSAEIRFTPRILITKDKRITAEFEYTERSYSRFLVYNENRWNGSNGSWYLNLYSESDARNQPLLQDLTDYDKSVLAAAGDNAALASVSSLRESLFRSDRVFYKVVDTLVNGVRYDSVLVQSFNPDSARFEATFSFVGAGQGDYEPAPSTANGRVFQWVAPDGGRHSGSWAPVTRLVMPQSKQVVSAGTRQRLGSRMDLEMETALTRSDQNTFSKIDDANNTGIGVMARLNRKDPLRRDSSLTIRSFLNYRFAGARFNPVERYRSVEFERDWNVAGNMTGQRENYLESGVALTGSDSLQAGYRAEYLKLGNGYSGLRQNTSGNIRISRWEANWTGSYLRSGDDFRNTAFLRHALSFRRTFGKVSLEGSEQAEDNRWRDPSADSLLTGSQAFQEFSLQAAAHDGQRQPWMIRLGERTDRLPTAGSMALDTRALDAESWVDLSKNPAIPFRAGFHFRTLSGGTDTLSAADQTGNTLTGRIDNRWQAWKGLVKSRTFFEMGSGFDRKIEYSYLEVAAGQGYYTWKDYNSDGVKQLNEFETAWFSDQASYIRVSRPGTGFVPTLVNRFNQVFTIQPKKGFASRFSSQLAYRIDKKTGREDYLFLINPFTVNPTDQRLINLTSQLRHSLAFNRPGQKFSAEWILQQQSARTTLINGADGRKSGSSSLMLRYTINPSWQLNSTSDLSRKQSVSEFFHDRNYLLVSKSQNLKAECILGGKFRIGLDWELRSENDRTNGSALLSNQLESALTLQVPGKGQISLTTSYVYIRFDGQADSPAGYTMLRGFTDGGNGVARLAVRYKLGKYLVLEGNYEGRLASGFKPVHNAQLQLRAVF
jgi:hypothetical protein